VHVLYLHQYFVTRHGFTGTRSYEFARRLVARGHRVTMLKSGRFAVDGLDTPPGQHNTETTSKAFASYRSRPASRIHTKAPA
jgi:hypothetical protein